MFAIAAAVVADAIRRKVVWVVLVFAVFLGLSIPALPSYGVGVAASVFREVAIALTYVAALVVALALSATRIPMEVERRTVFNVISRDVRRWQYVAGRWLGMFVVLGGVIALCSAATIAIGYFTIPGGEVMWRLLEAALRCLARSRRHHGVRGYAVLLVSARSRQSWERLRSRSSAMRSCRF